MKKVLLALIFCITVIAFVLSASAKVYRGDRGVGDNRFEWVLDTATGLLEISGTGKIHDFAGSNPAPWHGYSESIKNVVIKDGIKHIGDYAFDYCTNLESVSIPESVTSIGDSAFSYCYDLKNINIPDSITSFGKSAFSHCFSIESIDIPKGTTSISDYMFSRCRALKSVSIPEGVTYIGISAFDECSLLESISLPGSVTFVGEKAFLYCESLESINIPYGVTSIGNSAFCYCYSLKNINIPYGVTSIGNNAFALCKSLESISIPATVKSIGNYAFSMCEALEKVTIYSRKAEFGTNVFEDCHSSFTIYGYAGSASEDYANEKGHPFVPLPVFVVIRVYDKCFTDIAEQHWYYDYVKTAYEYALANGTSASTFSPDSKFTVAQALTAAANIHSIYNGTSVDAAKSGEAWYTPYVNYCINNGIITAGQFADVNKNITRGEMAIVFANILPDSEYEAVRSGSTPDVTSDMACYGAVQKLYNAGIVGGDAATGNFRPNDEIVRSEACVIFTRIAAKEYRAK